MWEWFLSNGVWILAALVAGAALFWVLWRWAKRFISKATPQEKRQKLDRSRKIIGWTALAVGGGLITLAVVMVIIKILGADISPLLGTLWSWFLERGIRILVIIGIGYLLYLLDKVILPPLVSRSTKARGKGRRAQMEVEKRAQTLSRLFTQTIGIIIITITLLIILSELGVNIAPLLAGAGVAGIAIGFGAQHLIKDLINGIFILVEDQYNVGDVVRIAGVAGLVEHINLRRTVLRDLDGIVHSIPNGEITTSSNYTKEWSRVNLDIPVAYGEDLDHCFEVINRVGRELASDEVFGHLITSAPQALRVQNFGDSGIEIKILGETKPLKQWAVTGELRKRLKKAFDEEDIEIPWPHVKLYFGESKTGKDIICSACSSPNPPGSRFCANCGGELGKP